VDGKGKADIRLESSVAGAGCNGTSALNGTETNDLWNRQIFNSPETFLQPFLGNVL
jgi:hypothetical protein